MFGHLEYTGIDIGAGSVKVVRISRGKRPMLLSAAFVDRGTDNAAQPVGAILASLMDRKQIGKKNIVTMMPSRDITIRAVTLPDIPRDELDEAVRWEAKRHISYSPDTAQIDYLVVGERRDGGAAKIDVVLVAAETERVEAHLAPLRTAGIAPHAVDVNAFALRNGLRARPMPVAGELLVIDIGAGTTEINIYDDAVLRFSRCIESGGHDMSKLIADELGVGLADAESMKRSLNVLASPDDDRAAAALRQRLDALCQEIRRSADYYRTSLRTRGVQRAILTGGAALMAGVAGYVERALNLPVEIDDPLAPLDMDEQLKREIGPVAPQFSAAIGLALRSE
jgi:type IV pilus assembly protein PilM